MLEEGGELEHLVLVGQLDAVAAARLVDLLAEDRVEEDLDYGLERGLQRMLAAVRAAQRVRGAEQLELVEAAELEEYGGQHVAVDGERVGHARAGERVPQPHQTRPQVVEQIVGRPVEAHGGAHVVAAHLAEYEVDDEVVGAQVVVVVALERLVEVAEQGAEERLQHAAEQQQRTLRHRRRLHDVDEELVLVEQRRPRGRRRRRRHRLARELHLGRFGHVRRALTRRRVDVVCGSSGSSSSSSGCGGRCCCVALATGADETVEGGLGLGARRVAVEHELEQVPAGRAHVHAVGPEQELEQAELHETQVEVPMVHAHRGQVNRVEKLDVQILHAPRRHELHNGRRQLIHRLRFDRLWGGRRC